MRHPPGRWVQCHPVPVKCLTVLLAVAVTTVGVVVVAVVLCLLIVVCSLS